MAGLYDIAVGGVRYKAGEKNSLLLWFIRQLYLFTVLC